MKRRSKQEPKRDRELEQVKALTTVTMTEDDFYARLKGEKAALEMNMAQTLSARNELRKFCRNHPAEDPIVEIEGIAAPASAHFDRYADLIRDYSAQLRRVKAQL